MSATSSELAGRLDAIGEQLGKQRRGADLMSFVTVVLGVAVLGGLTFWFWLGLVWAKELTNPKGIADFVDDQIESQVPEQRKALQDYVLKSAPDWAKSGSVGIEESIPGACEWLAEFVVEKIDDQLSTTQETARGHLKAYLKANHAQIKEGLDRLSADPKSSEQFISELVKSFERDQGIEVQGMIKDTLNYMKTLNGQIAKLKGGKGLTERERILREMLMILRRVSAEQAVAPPVPIAAPAPVSAL